MKTIRRQYPDYQDRCGWNALLPARQASPALRGDRRCDVVVIGAGYTGIATARRWAQLRPDADIVLIDAAEIGEGNAGRNSGFLLEISLANDADPAALDRMTACNRLIGDTLRELVAEAETSAIDCALRRTGTYRAAAGDAGVAALRRYRQFLEASGLPHDVLDGEQLAARLGTRFYLEGLYSPHCYLVQPAALIRVLAASLPATVQLYESTPATSVRRRGRAWRVSTPAGTLSAPHAVLANNAFCKELGIGGSRVVAMYTSAALTRPLPPSAVPDGGSEPEWGLLPAHRLGSTLRRTADNRLLIRSLYGYERETDRTTVATALHKALARRFPALPAAPFDSVWSGATGFTINGAPLWGEFAPQLYVSAGCNGGGVVKGTLFGRVLAESACGLETVDIAALFGRAGWLPPEPFRRLGFQAVSALERRRGRAEV